jgi:glycosyltransferase involved in cell wall biosynthesis
MSPTKNIWVINQYIDTPPDFESHRHYSLAKNWIKYGFKVTLINGSFSHIKTDKANNQKEHFQLRHLEKSIDLLTIKVNSYGSSLSFGRFWNMILFCVKLFFIPTKDLKQPDIILVSSTSLFPIINGYFLKRKFKGAKLVFEIRDIWPLTLIELNGSSKFHPLIILLAKIEKFGYKQADWITSTLEHADNHIKRIIDKKFHFTWIGNGINLESISSTNETKYTLPKDKINITYVGTLGTANALEFLIEAAIQLQNNPRIQFHIFGDGYMSEKLQKLAQKANNVSFHGKIEHKQVFNIYSQSDLLYLGWRNKEIYKFGVSANKIFEYLLAGKPILMSGNHIQSDPVSLAKAGLIVPSENVDAIVKAIIDFVAMPNSAKEQMGLNAYNYVMQNHTYDFLAKKYMQVFQNLDLLNNETDH